MYKCVACGREVAHHPGAYPYCQECGGQLEAVPAVTAVPLIKKISPPRADQKISDILSKFLKGEGPMITDFIKKSSEGQVGAQVAANYAAGLMVHVKCDTCGRTNNVHITYMERYGTCSGTFRAPCPGKYVSIEDQADFERIRALHLRSY
jgi:predicted nucleic acid-binding Zn ribbon protein